MSREAPLSGASLPFRLVMRADYDVTGTVTVSETVESSWSVMVAFVKVTSVTVAVHIEFGHEPGGAVGAVVVTLNLNWPFLGVGTGPVVPATVVLKF